MNLNLRLFLGLLVGVLASCNGLLAQGYAGSPGMNISTHLLSPVRENYLLEVEYRIRRHSGVYLTVARSRPYEDQTRVPSNMYSGMGMGLGYRHYLRLDAQGRSLLTAGVQVGVTKGRDWMAFLMDEEDPLRPRFDEIGTHVVMGFRRQLAGPLWMEPRVGIGYAWHWDHVVRLVGNTVATEVLEKGGLSVPMGVNLGFNF